MNVGISSSVSRSFSGFIVSPDSVSVIFAVLSGDLVRALLLSVEDVFAAAILVLRMFVLL